VPTSHPENEVSRRRHKASKGENLRRKGKTAQICPYPPAQPVRACPGPHRGGGGSAALPSPPLAALPSMPRSGQRCPRPLPTAARAGPWHPAAQPHCQLPPAPHRRRPPPERGEGPSPASPESGFLLSPLRRGPPAGHCSLSD